MMIYLQNCDKHNKPKIWSSDAHLYQNLGNVLIETQGESFFLDSILNKTARPLQLLKSNSNDVSNSANQINKNFRFEIIFNYTL